MWGQDCVGCAAVDKHIIIPTRVGTRHYPANLSKTAGDHPHACGDKSSLSFLAKEEQGSSPRVWGQALATSSSSYGRGIIPTRVGTSTHLRAKSLSAQDHPHACGDKCGVPQLFYELRGSSPRVWGQVFDIFSAAIATGIIPTRVGTRCPCHFKAISYQDHPHACGDKGDFVILRRKPLGSSPRVWGQAIKLLTLSDIAGIIPTRVGTRCQTPCQAS